MEKENTLDPQVKSKDIIRKSIRNCLTYKNSNPPRDTDMKVPMYKNIDNVYSTFVQNFRKAGGLYVPCNNIKGSEKNLVHRLVGILKGQKYTSIVNTCPNVEMFLNKYKVRHVNALNANETADAAVFFSDMLIARDGSIGFTQDNVQYASIRNMASNIIIISFLPCIYMEREEALTAYQVDNKGQNPAIVEFVKPTPLDNINNAMGGTPSNPQYILLMVDEQVFPPSKPQPQEPEQDQTPSNTQTDIQHEFQNEESNN